MTLDDLGTEVSPGRPARRVVSLVPSLTEVIASVDPALLVGATQWCTHPADLDVVRVRGTKNPDVARILALAPDLVVANREENRALDVHRLREAGVPVWVTRIETLDEAFASMRRLVSEALEREVPAWIGEAEAAWRETPPAGRGRVAVAVWRDPWMVVGRDTFTGDLVRRLGWEHAFAGSDDRYPHVDIDDLDHTGLDLVLLPDEPYAFTADDGPESFTHVPTELVPGRLLTWYGPSLLEAHEILR
ncbi:helical backbone metal receptor [Mumia zhuanghuii]|uniref:Cobalamin-binding protein n=1 Tax=Mumia zhuanghuii TaxID=2585211 RepID=A0A5C4MGZ7_9ACTN|nr:helical backbone metal receptor [Mumia zhuanghuii]TNC42289.1 cobalamin-binding protein [Mumia zhuanghuii]TNC46337.1 cobalamin-binding protein [Mumia zhuanghuii]